MPSSPWRLYPHAHTVPSDLRATVNLLPTPTSSTAVRKPLPPGPTTCTGASSYSLDFPLPSWPLPSGPFAVPMPSWPSPFKPHVHTVPSLRRATLWELPPATATTRSSWPFPLGPTTGVGVCAHAALSASAPPGGRCADGRGGAPGAALARVGHCCGPVVVPTPSSPQMLPPQAHTR